MAVIYIIGNYAPDGQQSMERFASMLADGFALQGHVTKILRPNAYFGRSFRSTNSGLGKWFGYVDKWLIFPQALRRLVRQLRREGKLERCRFHLADHSNSPYLSVLPAEQTVVTCHDVLAIRGALGDTEVSCPASRMGKYLQATISHHLLRARKIAAVSKTTLNDIYRIAGLANDEPSASHDWRVILNALNAAFAPLEPSEISQHLKRFELDRVPYLLHVGSNLPRKNRQLMLELLADGKEAFPGKICFAGAPADTELVSRAATLGIEDRLISIEGPSHEMLNALYSGCFAFLFPSLSEGFGWPLIEAQACGAPVIASDRQPMVEVSNGSALHANPKDSRAWAHVLEKLADPAFRNRVIADGFENVQRFRPQRMLDEYCEFHGLSGIPHAEAV